MKPADSLLEFPCQFPIKVVGTNTETFASEMLQLAQKYFPAFTDADMKIQLSKKNNYISLTLTVYALDQETLNALYQELSAHPDSKMVL